jgi:hypothetical protein
MSVILTVSCCLQSVVPFLGPCEAVRCPPPPRRTQTAAKNSPTTVDNQPPELAHACEAGLAIAVISMFFQSAPLSPLCCFVPGAHSCVE